MSALQSSNKIKEFALLGLLAFLWGASYPLVKVAVETIPPVTLIAIRVSVAAVFLITVVHIQGHKFPRDKKVWRALLIQAFFNSIGAWTILAWGQQYITSGLASILNSTSPIFVFLFTAFITRHEAAPLRKLIGMMFGVLGVCLIIGVEALNGLGQQVVAQFAALFGAVLYACAAIFGSRFKTLPAVVTAAGTMIWATVWLVPLALIVDSPWALSFSFNSVVAALILATFSTAIALLIYFRLVVTLGSMGVASQSYLRAGVGVLLGVIFLGEPFGATTGFGLLAVIIAVIAINSPAKK